MEKKEKKAEYKWVFTIHWTTKEREEEIVVNEWDLYLAVQRLDYILTEWRYIPNVVVRAERIKLD